RPDPDQPRALLTSTSMTTRRAGLVRQALSAALLASLVAACSGSPGTPAKASPSSPAQASPGVGTAAAPLVLRIGTDDGDQAPGAGQITHFAQEVGTRSHGTIRIEPVWHADGHGVAHWDQAVAGMLFNGKIDLAMVPSRAWDDL